MVLLKSKFLLIDDDDDDAVIFCEALASIASDIQCHSIENGRLAIEFLKANWGALPDVIFLDINMPIMNGWECLAKLKETPTLSNIPTIMYSTSSAKWDIDMAYSLRAFVFLVKPENFKELCSVLETVAFSPQASLADRLAQFKSVK